MGLARILECMFKEMDTTNKGWISADVFVKHLQDGAFTEYLRALELDVNDAIELYKLLDADASGYVSIAEFVEGCQRLKGDCSKLSLAGLHYDIRRIGRVVNQLSQA